MDDVSEQIRALSEPLPLPCGRSVPNRFVKAAMYESLADFGGGPPNQKHFNLYARWATGGWGMIITGNVQVDKMHLTLGRDIVVPEEMSPHSLAPFVQLASAMREPSSTSLDSTLSIMQLSHAGRQSPRLLGGRPLLKEAVAPSAVAMQPREGIISGAFHRILFPTPREMTNEEISGLIEAFIRGALVAHETGFDGIQIHCSHGYLLSQFLSPKVNRRPPPYGFPDYTAVLRDIVKGIRARVPSNFVLGVKMNAADYVEGGVTEAQALGQLQAIAEWGGVDFIEISGGDYENPDFMRAASPRQAFFSRFSRLAVAALAEHDLPPVVMLTGSLRSRCLMAKTIGSDHAHLLGVARPAVLYPSLPRHFLTVPRSMPKDTKSDAFKSLQQGSPMYPAPRRSALLGFVPVHLVGAGVDMAWYCALMWRIGSLAWDGLDDPFGEDSVMGSQVPSIGAFQSLWEMWFRN